MAENKEQITLTGVISSAMKIPGIRVDRDAFLREQFKNEDAAALNHIVAAGPVAAGCDRDALRRKAEASVFSTTLMSTGASFLAGLPGGLAVAVTIPADILQFYAAALKMAQEIAYLYGEPELPEAGSPEEGEAMNRLVLYCGVMLGASGAAPAVRLSSSAFARQLLKRQPAAPPEKNYIVPVVRSVLNFFAKAITKTSVAKGVTKMIPVLGGLVSGGITFASLRPMGSRLREALDKAHFSYSDADIQNDILEIEKVTAEAEAQGAPEELPEELPEAAPEKAEEAEKPEKPAGAAPAIDYDGIRKAKELLDEGIIDEKEFAAIKARIITGR